MKQGKNRKKVKYCVICEVEGIRTESTEELDIGFGPAPVCKRHYQKHKNDYYNNIQFIDEHL
jgi:hypothetical protein